MASAPTAEVEVEELAVVAVTVAVAVVAVDCARAISSGGSRCARLLAGDRGEAFASGEARVASSDAPAAAQEASEAE